MLNNPRFNGKVYTHLMTPGAGSTGIEPDGAFTGVSQDEHVLSLGELLQVLWRRMWIIMLVTILLVGLVVGFDLQRPPVYAASSKILVGQQSNVNPAVATSVYDLQQLTLTMAEAVASRPVAKAASERLDMPIAPEDLLEDLDAEAVQETQFIEVTYTDTNKARAQRVANAVSAAFADRVTEVSPSVNAVTATVWEKAELPDTPVSPNPVRDGLLALVLGGMLGIGLAFLLEHLDDRWRSPEELEQISGVPTFGVIPEFKVVKASKRRGGD